MGWQMEAGYSGLLILPTYTERVCAAWRIGDLMVVLGAWPPITSATRFLEPLILAFYIPHEYFYVNGPVSRGRMNVHYYIMGYFKQSVHVHRVCMLGSM